MKTKKKKLNLLKKTYTNFTIKIIGWTIGLPVVFLILAEIINFFDFQWLYNYSPNLYYRAIRLANFLLFRGYTPFIVSGIWIIGVMVLVYRLLRRVFAFIQAVSLASTRIIEQDTEYIELPKELNDLEKQLNQLMRDSQKNARLARESEQKKNDLVVYLAHDLKTPLTSMVGYLSLLDEVPDMPEKQREKYIRIALEKSYKLEDLINELFDITRFNSETIILEKEDINLSMMLEQLVDDFYPILQESHKKIDVHIPEKIILKGDSERLARVFSNLIKNAIYYSTDSLIRIDVQKDKDSVCIIMSNRGKQIPQEKLERLFEKFYRADHSRTTRTGGSGLGLAIAKEIVELHGGTIWATSDEEFTKFYVTLPFHNLK